MLSSLRGAFPAAILALADGRVFEGESIGAAGTTTGELVFHTAMSGYQEVLTDPAYCGQMVAFTYPHIGSCGVNAEDAESSRIQAAGIIVRDLPLRSSNFRAEQGLDEHLAAAGAVAIAGVDTRQITRLVREKGRQRAAIVALAVGETLTDAHLEQARTQAASAAPARPVQADTTAPRDWRETLWQLGQGYAQIDDAPHHVVAIDLGSRRHDLRRMVAQGCRLTLLPADASAADVAALKPDGVVLTDGPGNPADCTAAQTTARELLGQRIPMLGLGLGMQVLALAAGAKAGAQLASGHHGANHPVRDVAQGGVCITNQKLDWVLDVASLPAGWQVTNISMIDGGVQGIGSPDGRALGFAGEPHTTSGPVVAGDWLARFVDLMQSVS